MKLEDRMKEYESISDFILTPKIPMIIRVDGKCFHTLLGDAEKPFDVKVIQNMWKTGTVLCSLIAGAKIAYVQSDEISILIRDDESIETQAWLNKRIQKLCSIAASIASVTFTREYGKTAYFDSRCFILPEYEILNYFIWRQQEATRNSIAALAHVNFSNKQLHQKNVDEMQEMLFKEKAINFNDLPTYIKRGACILKFKVPFKNEHGEFIRNEWKPDTDIPIFTQNREYLEKLIRCQPSELTPAIIA